MQERKKKKKEKGRGSERELACVYARHLSIFVSRERENKGSAMEREKQRGRDSVILQPTPRAHHHIIQFGSISTRGSSRSGYSGGNEHE